MSYKVLIDDTEESARDFLPLMLISVPLIALVIIVSIFLNGCGNPPPKTLVASASATCSPKYSAPSPTPTAAPKALISAKTTKTKTATIISENANLRETANQNGSIVEEISEAAEVEVVKQKGAWFLVRASGQEGLLHGNTIRIADQSEILVPSQSTTTYSKPSTSYSAPSKTIDNSGASARCRDGSLSYSAHRRGTCSHHGGVSEWLSSSPTTEYTPAPIYPAPRSSSSRYIRGPRGGCYYINGSGNKSYVDRGLCN